MKFENIFLHNEMLLIMETFSAKRWKELTNDIRTKVGTNEVNKNIPSLKFD